MPHLLSNITLLPTDGYIWVFITIILLPCCCSWLYLEDRDYNSTARLWTATFSSKLFCFSLAISLWLSKSSLKRPRVLFFSVMACWWVSCISLMWLPFQHLFYKSFHQRCSLFKWKGLSMVPSKLMQVSCGFLRVGSLCSTNLGLHTNFFIFHSSGMTRGHKLIII